MDAVNNNLTARLATPPQGNAREKEVRQLVQKLLGQTFFGPIMKQMRSSPWKDPVMSGGRGGEAFQNMMDQKMVEQMGKSIGGPMVDAMTNQILGRPRDFARLKVEVEKQSQPNHVQLDLRA